MIPVWKLPELHELTTTIGCWCQTVQYGRNRAVCVPKSTEVVASLPTPFATVCQSLPFSETLTAKEPPEVIRASAEELVSAGFPVPPGLSCDFR